MSKADSHIEFDQFRQRVIHVVSADPLVNQKFERLIDKGIKVCFEQEAASLLKADRQQKTIKILDAEYFQDSSELKQLIKGLQKQGTPHFVLAPASNKSAHLLSGIRPYVYLLKPIRTKDLMMALQMLCLKLDQDSGKSQGEMHSKFTKAEQMILSLIADNKTTKSIAKALHVSESTIKNHRHNIAKKLKLSGDTHSLKNWVFQNSDQF